jgi:membrane-associated phospholipid phosphatase
MSTATSGADAQERARAGPAADKGWRPTSRYRRRALAGTLTCLALVGVLTVAVILGATHSLDVWAREQFRPDLVWGPDQQRWSHVVSWLAPSRMVLLLGIGAAGVSLWRLTLWPLVQSAFVVALTGGMTLAIKLVVDRSDPRGEHTALGGSFPSGHSAMLLVCVATGAMLVSCPTRWWQRVGVLLLEAVLAVGMMYIALHWLTDIVGGALVAGVVLGVMALIAGPDGGPSHRGRRHRFRRPAAADVPGLSGRPADTRGS